MGQDAQRQGQDQVLDVLQEELRVGKRSLDKGGVRVVQRVTETPVREVVRLREEHAPVDRRPVDREATAGDLGIAFREGTVEVREMAEESVVAKTARVVEEVRVAKDVRERAVHRTARTSHRWPSGTPTRAPVEAAGRCAGTTRPPDRGPQRQPGPTGAGRH